MQNFIFRQTFTPEMHRSWLATKVATGQVVQYIILDNATASPSGRFITAILTTTTAVPSTASSSVRKAPAARAWHRDGPPVHRFGFAGLHLHRISLRVLAENAAARRSYEKAGFVQEGVFRDMELLDGAYRDVVFMAKLAEN